MLDNAYIRIDDIITITRGKSEIIVIETDELHEKLQAIGKSEAQFFDHVTMLAEVVGISVEIVRDSDEERFIFRTTPGKTKRRSKWVSDLSPWQIIVYYTAGVLTANLVHLVFLWTS
jgi:hypothetical protein